MGIFDRFRPAQRRRKRAEKYEIVGDLKQAIAEFIAAGFPDQAARVMVTVAASKTSLDERLQILASAHRLAPLSDAGLTARRQRAVLLFDLAQNRPGQPLQSELLSVAKELEEVGAFVEAADAYKLAGNADGEVRALKAGGQIEALEKRLFDEAHSRRQQTRQGQLVQTIQDLDAVAERRQALRAAEKWLAMQNDEQVAVLAERIRSRMLLGPVVRIELDGEPLRVVLGDEINIGRANSDIVVNSNAVSRQHLRLHRLDGVAAVTDLDTRNGTTLAGARLHGSLPIGSGLDLVLAGAVPCTIRPRRRTDASGPTAAVPDELTVTIGSLTYVVPLGPFHAGPWRLVDGHEGKERFVLLKTPQEATTPVLGDYRCRRQIELCVGDRFRVNKDTSPLLTIPDQAE